MNTGTYGLETVEADQYQTMLGYDIGYVTAESYPLFAPYRARTKGAFSGRVPRLLSIIFTTLVNTPSHEWDGENRTLTIGDDFFYLANKLGMSSGGDGRTIVRDKILLFAQTEFTRSDGTKSIPLETTEISNASLAVEKRKLVFTEQFTEMMTQNVRQLPLRCLYPNAGNAVTIDLLILASLYCPDDRKLIIEKEDLPTLLPASRQSISERSLSGRFSKLNDSQNEWTFRMTKKTISISPFGVYSSDGALRLRRKQD